MTFLLAAAIAFGPLGPVQHVTLEGGGLRADVAYRIAHDRDHDTGDAAASPSIAAGTLTVVTDGRRYVLDLGTVFPIRTNRIVIQAHPPLYGCGVTRTLTHTQRYLAIEAVLAEKGCAPVVAFVDLTTGTAAEPAVLDPAWNHRFDASAERFDGVRLRIVRIDRIVLERASWDGAALRRVAWRSAVVHAVAADGRRHLLAFDLDPDGLSPGNRAANVVPSVGSSIDLGSLTAPYTTYPVRYFADQRVVHLSGPDNERFAHTEPPTPPNAARLAFRNSWFKRAGDEAGAGHLHDAVEAFATMLTYEDDPSLAAAETKMLSQCRELESRVRSGAMDVSTASALFPDKCSGGNATSR